MEEFKKQLFDFKAIIAFVALVLTFITFFFRYKKKRLGWEIISILPLFHLYDEMDGRIKIYLDDKLVEKLKLIIIRIENIGNDAIATKDFETPIVLDYGDNATVLSVEIQRKFPAELPAQISIDNNTTKLDPLLLNPDDSIIINALVNKPNKKPKINARIVGVNVEEIIDADDYYPRTLPLARFTIIPIILFFIVIALESNGVLDERYAVVIASFLGFLYLLCASLFLTLNGLRKISSFIRRRKRQKRKMN